MIAVRNNVDNLLQSPDNSTWTETIKDTTFTPNRVDSSNGLSNFRTWIQNTTSLPEHDHAMLYTRQVFKYGISLEYYIIQLFNGSATGNRSKYLSRGIGKDESVLLPEVNDRG